MVAVSSEQLLPAAGRERIWSAISGGLLALLSLAYLVSALRIAAVRPLWMDEVLAVWTARLPSVSTIWQALEKGSDFSPPLYALLLHGILRLGGTGYLLLRLPSIIAVLVVGVAVFVLVRRRYPPPVAALATGLCLIGGLYPFALEVRQYALVAACVALAIAIWDIPAERSPSWRGATAMLVLLVAAVGMHFYAVLLVGAMGLMELAWTATHRRIRWLHVAVIALACLSVLLWLPIMQHVASFTRGDNMAPDYYARPLPGRLLATYAALLAGHRPIWLSPLMLFELAAVGSVIVALRRSTGTALRRLTPDNLDIIVGVSCAIPLLVFLFALALTNTFNLRYTVAAAPGLVILVARLVSQLPQASLLCASVLLVATGAAFTPDTTAASAAFRGRVIALAEQAPAGLPIVTGNGLRFFELREGAGAAVAHRLVFIRTPPGIDNPDPTNEHQVERWKNVAPHLPVVSLAPFLKSNSRFLVFSDCSAVDLLPKLLAGRGYHLRVVARTGCAELSEVDRTLDK